METNKKEEDGKTEIYLEDIAEYIPGVKTALDVGCSTGTFLVKLRDRYGIKVKGIELSWRFREYVQDLNITCDENTYQLRRNAGMANLKFDLVTAFHVLEHQLDPINFLKSLRPFVGGHLVIRVPDRGLAVAHPIMIGQGPLVALLIRAGYSVEKVISRLMPNTNIDLTAIATPRLETPKAGRDARRLQS
jgi:2-polyprenyl-3-methyl-5-hydroxy-6-metoxy-1,4-benzoquinol methylase